MLLGQCCLVDLSARYVFSLEQMDTWIKYLAQEVNIRYNYYYDIITQNMKCNILRGAAMSRADLDCKILVFLLKYVNYSHLNLVSKLLFIECVTKIKVHSIGY